MEAGKSAMRQLGESLGDKITELYTTRTYISTDHPIE